MYRRELGAYPHGSLVAIEEFRIRAKELPSADITDIDITLELKSGRKPSLNEIATWDNGHGHIPHIGIDQPINPRSMLKAAPVDGSVWPRTIQLKRQLEGINRTLNYTLELIETAKDLCVRGYHIESVSKAKLEGRSLDSVRTKCSVELVIENGVFILKGVPPQPEDKTAERERQRIGW